MPGDQEAALTGRSARLPHHLGILDRGGPQNDPGDPGFEPHFDRRQIADTAAQLDLRARRTRGGKNPPNRSAVDRLTGEGPVQIDDMEPRGAGGDKGRRLRRRVIVEHGRLRHVAAQQAHALAIFQIYRWKQDHGGG